MFIAKYNLVKARFLCNEGYFDHMLTALYNLHRKHAFQCFGWMGDHFIFFSFVKDFEFTFSVFCSVEAKLYIIFSGLKHYTNDRIGLVHFDNSIVLLAS